MRARVGFETRAAATAAALALDMPAADSPHSQAALDAAVERGNRLLRQFERANPDR
jgi:hypothetical protein